MKKYIYTVFYIYPSLSVFFLLQVGSGNSNILSLQPEGLTLVFLVGQVFLATDFLSFCLSGNILISPFLKHSFVGLAFLVHRLLFQHFEYFIQYLLISMVSNEKSAVDLIGKPLQVLSYFSLPAFQILLLLWNVFQCGSLSFSYLEFIELLKRVVFSLFLLPSLPTSPHSICLFISLSLDSSGTPVMNILICLMVSCWSLTYCFSSFFYHFIPQAQ